MKLFISTFLVCFSFSFFGQDNPETIGDNPGNIQGVVVKPEYLFDNQVIVKKKGDSDPITINTNASDEVGIEGVVTTIGKFDYHETVINLNTDEYVYLDSKSQTGITSIIPSVSSESKFEIVLSLEEEEVLDKKCNVITFENDKFVYELWFTKEDNKSVVTSSKNSLVALMALELLGDLSSLKLNKQVWMKVVVTNKKTKKSSTFEVQKYYNQQEANIMVLDYKFIIPSWE